MCQCFPSDTPGSTARLCLHSNVGKKYHEVRGSIDRSGIIWLITAIIGNEIERYNYENYLRVSQFRYDWATIPSLPGVLGAIVVWDLSEGRDLRWAETHLLRHQIVFWNVVLWTAAAAVILYARFLWRDRQLRRASCAARNTGKKA